MKEPRITLRVNGVSTFWIPGDNVQTDNKICIVEIVEDGSSTTPREWSGSVINKVDRGLGPQRDWLHCNVRMQPCPDQSAVADSPVQSNEQDGEPFMAFASSSAASSDLILIDVSFTHHKTNKELFSVVEAAKI